VVIDKPLRRGVPGKRARRVAAPGGSVEALNPAAGASAKRSMASSEASSVLALLARSGASRTQAKLEEHGLVAGDGCLAFALVG
jgi:hypothetical protein